MPSAPLKAAICAVFALTAAAIPALPAPAYSYATEKPLVIIRFNQRSVMFERPLYVAISRALQTKPTAVFDIVSMAPSSGGQKAETDLSRVISTLIEMGVPRSRLNISRQPGSGAEYAEVHIFVR